MSAARPLEFRDVERGRALQARLEQDAHASPERAHRTADAFRHPWLWVLALVYFVVPVALYAFGFFLPQILLLFLFVLQGATGVDFPKKCDIT